MYLIITAIYLGTMGSALLGKPIPISDDEDDDDDNDDADADSVTSSRKDKT